MSTLAPDLDRGAADRNAGWRAALRARPSSAIAVFVLVLIAAVSIFAPLLTPHDPGQIAPALRLRPPGDDHFLGTDSYGRDLFTRLLYGGRVSLLIGLGAAAIGTLSGLVLGLLAGYFRAIDTLFMRVMDGLMAIPNVLLAIAVVALWGGNLAAVLIAITIPEIPRVTRLTRSVILSAREETYVAAAVTLGSSSITILWRHLMPNAIGPLIVQATYICASAVLLESILSFLGVGINPEIPTWGNIMAEGRLYFLIKPSLIFWPALLLSLTILSVNILGDALRDTLDPRTATRTQRDGAA